MVLDGVVVYIKYMKVGGGAIIPGFVYGRPKKVISLSPPHYAMALCVNLANTKQISIPYNVYYVK